MSVAGLKPVEETSKRAVVPAFFCLTSCRKLFSSAHGSDLQNEFDRLNFGRSLIH